MDDTLIYREDIPTPPLSPEIRRINKQARLKLKEARPLGKVGINFIYVPTHYGVTSPGNLLTNSACNMYTYIVNKFCKPLDTRSGKACLQIDVIAKLLQFTGPPKYITFYVNISPSLFILDSIEDLFEYWGDVVDSRMEKAAESLEGSGWVVESIKLVSNKMLKTGLVSMRSFKEYPKDCRGSRSIVNLNLGENCFCTSVAAGLVIEGRRRRGVNDLKASLSRDVRRMLDRDKNLYIDKEAALVLSDVDRYEKVNSLRIYIYALTQTSVTLPQGGVNNKFNKYTINIVRGPKSQEGQEINLIHFGGDHVALISNFEDYVRSFGRVQNKGYNLHTDDVHICKYCLSIFNTQNMSELHTSKCRNKTRALYPKKGDVLRFKAHEATYPRSHVAFADLETYGEPVDDDVDDPTSRITKHHKAYQCCFLIYDLREGRVVSTFTYTGLDCTDIMIEKINTEWARLSREMVSYELHMSPQQQREYNAATHCQICAVGFSDTVIKVRHHLHYKQYHNYESALCSKCNIKIKNKAKFIPCYFHNLAYNGCIILKDCSARNKFRDIVRRDASKYYKIRSGYVDFVCSANLLQGSLAKLSDNHIKNNGDLTCLNKMLDSYNSSVRAFVQGKQSFPYSYITSYEKLSEPNLPSRAEFRNNLTGEIPTEQEYEIILDLFREAGCRNIGEYSELYIKCDVGLLADVFLAFRSTFYTKFTLDPTYFLTSTSLSLQALLLSSGVSLPLPHSPDVVACLRGGVRGGLCQANAKIFNGRFQTDPAISSNTNKYGIYLDYNSLYPTVMAKYKFPTSEIRMMGEAELEQFKARNLLDINPHGPVGYILVIDTDTPSREVIDRTDDLPLSIHHLDITPDMMSKTTKELYGDHIPKHNKKLVASHLPVSNYPIALARLQRLIKLGLVIKKVRSVYFYEQGNYLGEYMTGLARMRASEPSDEGRNMIKLLMNSVYGVTVKDPTRYAKTYSLIDNSVSLMRCANSPFFEDVCELNEDRFLVTKNKKVVTHDSPIFIGFLVLDFAKDMMYHFYYDVLKQLYGDSVSLLYTDTDSFIISLDVPNLDEELAGPLKEYIDFSNFDKSHPLYDNSRKGELGLLKIETGCYRIVQAIFLKAKSYSIKVEGGGDDMKAAKGVPHTIQNLISHQDYVDCYEQARKIICDYMSLQNCNGAMSEVRNKKVALSSVDDKRLFKPDGTSHGIGHYSQSALTGENEREEEDASDGGVGSEEMGRSTKAEPGMYINKDLPLRFRRGIEKIKSKREKSGNADKTFKRKVDNIPGVRRVLNYDVEDDVDSEVRSPPRGTVGNRREMKEVRRKVKKVEGKNIPGVRRRLIYSDDDDDDDVVREVTSPARGKREPKDVNGRIKNSSRVKKEEGTKRVQEEETKCEKRGKEHKKMRRENAFVIKEAEEGGRKRRGENREKCNKKMKRENPFVITEAEDDGRGSESEEKLVDEEDLDKYDSSFINDESVDDDFYM